MKLLVVDGNSIINRAYYGIKALTTKNGEFTNGIYGFLSILRGMLDEVHPDAVACAFDMRAPTFRHKMYDGYKAQRKGMPEELASQLQPLKDLLTALGYQIITCEGYEADDILGTFAQSCTENGDLCVIATGDRDSLQLVGDAVTVRLATTRPGQAGAVIYDTAAVLQKYGVPPKELIDVKALMGDASDNIPGVAGVGEKTALDLISKYHDLDVIYRDIETLDIKPAVKAKLLKDKDMAYMSRALARIDCSAPIDTSLVHYVPRAPDKALCAKLFARFEMFALQKKWGIDSSAAEESSAAANEARETELLIEPKDAVARIKKAGSVALLITWDSDEPRMMAAALPEGVMLLQGELLDEILACGAKLRVWSSKALYRYLYKNNKEIQIVDFDGELAAYLLSPTTANYDLQQLAVQYGIFVKCPERLMPAGDMLLANKGALLPELLDAMEKEIVEKQQDKLLYEIEMPLARVLAVMECEGFSLDTDALRSYGTELDERLEELQKGIYLYACGEFNINSPRQLGEVLFDRLGLPAKKKTKTGYSTNADVLDTLRGKHPIVDLILEFRKLSKLKSTYVDGLLKVVGADGRVRSTFQQTETRTGRISSTEPNMQNIPVRTPEGSKMRKFFRARPGFKLLDADYSQIELRVLADIAKDENMIAAFQEGHDIHTATAAQVFKLPQEMVTPQLRSRAKAVNFGIVYGIGAYSLSQDIGVSVSEAKSYIEGYLATYSGVRQYMEDVVKFGRENGYVKTLFGRRRYLPELAAANKVTQAFGERVAMNTPIQGTAADIIKIAMVRVFERLNREGLRAKLILQVHDELLVEAPEEEVERASRILCEEMEHAIDLQVPLVAETHYGDNWLEAK